MSTTPDKLVERYLKHLDVELDDLPRDRRREIVDEISGHIVEARAGLQAESEADVRNILEGLGDPAEIAADARERFEVSPHPKAKSEAGWIEIGALIMLLVGGLVLPVIGWVIGVVLLWTSNVWNVRDKVIGTIFVPGGLGLPILLGTFALASTGGSHGCVQSGLVGAQPSINTCTGQGTSVTDVLGAVGLIVLLVAPIVTTVYLAMRMRRASAVAIA
ncbi:MAG TPA: DUF1700 domain-containing protein [Gaiellaceae bacterium]|nr:DUF1700 domain-containing protein [Gaiellaceae bacterium]